MKLNKYQLITIGLVGLTTCSGLALTSTHTFADNDTVTDTTTITVPVSCSMTGTINTAHTATLNPGIYSGDNADYTNGIGKTTLTTMCNDNNGFSIYAIGFTDDTYGTTTLKGTNTNTEIPTKVYASTDTTSNWSMKVTKVENPSQGDPVTYNPDNMTITNSFDNWHAVPSEYAKVAEYKSTTAPATTDTTLGAKVETTYSAFVSQTQPADTYTGKVKYTMVHPYSAEPTQPRAATPGCINYFANAGDAVGTMGCQSASDNASVILLASNFSRTGYGFAGWSDKFDYTTNNTAHFYGPQETITVPEGTTANGLSLYAVWVKSVGNFQDSSKVAQLCGTGTSSLTTAPTDGTANLTSVSALTDQRDNETYAIAKLADGKCWMIENLRLEAENTRTAEKQALAQGYGTSTTYGNFSGLADAESTNYSNSTIANSLYYSGTQSGTASVDIGTSDYPGYRIPRYNNLNTPSNPANRPQNPTSNSFTNDRTTVGLFSYGNYYNWHAAIADTAYYENENHGTTSLCPTGWRLPQGNTTSAGFVKLDIEMGGTGAYQTTIEASNKWRKYPVNFLFSGYFSDAAFLRGSHGYYMTSYANTGIYTYYMKLNSSSVSPSDNGFQYNGFSIRCTIDS